MRPIYALVMLMAVAMAGCMPGPIAKPLPKWQPPADVPRYGDWTVETSSCDLSATSADVLAESDGKLRGSLIAVELDFQLQLVKPPIVSLSGMPVSLPMDGRGKSYRVYLDYSPHTVAHMNEPGTFMVITYQPLNTTQPREVHFDTSGLMRGIAHVGRVCR